MEELLIKAIKDCLNQCLFEFRNVVDVRLVDNGLNEIFVIEIAKEKDNFSNQYESPSEFFELDLSRLPIQRVSK